MVNHNIYRVTDKYIKLWLALGFIFLLTGGTVILSVYSGYAPTENEQLLESETESFEMSSKVSSEVQQPRQFFERGDSIKGSVHFLYPNNTELKLTQTFRSETETTVDNTVYVRINGTTTGGNFWNERFIITDDSLEVNGDRSITSDIDISKYRERSAEVRNAYGQQGDVTVDIVVDADYSTDRYSGSLTNSSRLQFRNTVYNVIPPNLSDEHVHSYTIVAGTEETINPLYLNSGIGLVGVGLLFIFVRLFIANPNRVEKDYMLMQFSEWISVADSESVNLNERSDEICLRSCKDLVDVAADSRSRAILIEEENKVVTLKDDVLYKYEITESDNQPVRFSIFDRGDEEGDKGSDDDDTSELESKEDDKSQDEGFRFTD